MSRLSPLFACIWLVAACKRSPPDPPRFCDQDLSGVWLNSSDKHFSYALHDDGGVIHGEFMQRADDGGVARPAEPITFDLKRSGNGIAGVMRSTGTTPGGKACPVEFATRVTDCKPDAVQVVVEVSAPVGEDCKRLTAEDGGGYAPDLREFRFERERKSGDQSPK